MKTCAICKGRLETAAVDEAIKVDGHVFAAQLPAQRCTKCGETFVTAEAMGQFELAVAAHLAAAGANTHEAFRFMRKTLGLKGTELAALLDVTPETMSRWEGGKVAVPRSPAALLAAMVEDAVHGRTTTRDHLSRMQQPARLGDTVRVSISGAAA